jgi:multiple sugar transport system permease protein
VTQTSTAEQRSRAATPTAAITSAHSPKRGISAGRIAAWCTLILLIVVTIFPFLWMLRTALSSNQALLGGEQSLLPVDFTWVNFKRALGLATVEEALAAGGSGAEINFFVALRNSIIVSTLITAGQVIFCAMSAYAFARLTFPGRDKLFALFLAGLMVPGVFTLIPNFLLVQRLGWLNTYRGIVAPYFLMTPFAVFFLRQFFLGINREVEEAAKLDGAGTWTTFRRVIVPIAAAPLTTLALLTYIQAWNEYMWPLIVGQAPNVRVMTVALGIFRAQTPTATPDWSGMMAGAFLAALPIILLLMTVGRRMVDAIQFSGIK